MTAVVGPVLARPGGFFFDIWQPASGREPSFTYRRLEDAYYARNYELTQLQGVACDTLAAFMVEVGGRERVASIATMPSLAKEGSASPEA